MVSGRPAVPGLGLSGAQRTVARCDARGWVAVFPIAGFLRGFGAGERGLGEAAGGIGMGGGCRAAAGAGLGAGVKVSATACPG